MIPVVLAPGLLCDGRLWSRVRARVAAPVVEIDFAGDGELGAMAARVLREAPARFVLAGFSMGGMAAIMAAAAAPERVAGLALIDTHAEPETAARKARRARQIDSALRGSFRRLVLEELKPAYFAADAERTLERKLVADMALDLGPAQFRRHVLALMSRPDPEPFLSRLTMPACVIVGDDDRLAPPSAARALAARLARGRLVVAPACGHMAPLEAPEVVAREINALSEAA